MEELDFSQPAIVFWLQRAGLQPGEVTRFDRLDDAIHSVMQEPSAPTTCVAWIKTMDRHIAMDDIRGIARRGGLATWLSRSDQIKNASPDGLGSNAA